MTWDWAFGIPELVPLGRWRTLLTVVVLGTLLDAASCGQPWPCALLLLHLSLFASHCVNTLVGIW